MDFVAIDFETANEKRYSPCSLGITVIENNEIKEEKYWMIRPKENRFAPMNIMVHGIRPYDVINEPEFDELWPEIKPYLEHRLVVAHNASFDFSVLRNTLDLYGIDYPECDYCCTMLMSKHFYSFLGNAKLNTVNNFLGYEFSHHHASADASACANILIEISKELGTEDISQIAKATGVNVGSLYPNGYTKGGSCGTSLTSNRFLTDTIRPSKVLTGDYFVGKYVAFTGPLKSMSRGDAMAAIHEIGGFISSTVSRKTNVVVTNAKDALSQPPEYMSTKLRKTASLIEKGYSIEVINEEFFTKYLYS